MPRQRPCQPRHWGSARCIPTLPAPPALALGLGVQLLPKEVLQQPPKSREIGHFKVGFPRMECFTVVRLAHPEAIPLPQPQPMVGLLLVLRVSAPFACCSTWEHLGAVFWGSLCYFHLS